MSKVSLEALQMSGKVSQAREREELFSQNREAIMHLIRKSESVYNVCDGFYEDPKHLEGQFQYLTDSNISETIRKGLVGHLGSH